MNLQTILCPSTGRMNQGCRNGILANKTMALGADLQKKISQRYEASTIIPMRYRGNDLVVRTDDEGNAIVVFIGSKRDDGSIRGERYVRTLKRDSAGTVVKDHWECKGKV